ncbi:MAG: ferrous iron transport protein A [Mycobacteriales bacterium]
MVRKAIPDGFTDVVGDLVAWSDESLTIATRRGQVVVALAAIVAGKRIPPARPRRRPPPPSQDE